MLQGGFRHLTTPRSVHADCPTSSDATDGAPKQQICCCVRERIGRTIGRTDVTSRGPLPLAQRPCLAHFLAGGAQALSPEAIDPVWATAMFLISIAAVPSARASGAAPHSPAAISSKLVELPATAGIEEIMLPATRAKCPLVLLGVSADGASAVSLSLYESAAAILAERTPCTASLTRAHSSARVPAQLLASCQLPTICIMAAQGLPSKIPGRQPPPLGAYATLTLRSSDSADELARAVTALASRTTIVRADVNGPPSKPHEYLRSTLLPRPHLVNYPLRVIGGLADVRTAAANGETLVVLLTAPWVPDGRAAEAQLRWAAAQLRLRFRTVVAGIADVELSGGAEFCEASAAATATAHKLRRLPSFLIAHGGDVWQYDGPTNAASLVSHLSLWAIGQGPPSATAALQVPPRPPGSQAVHASGLPLTPLLSLPPAHLVGPTPSLSTFMTPCWAHIVSEPAGSHVVPLSAANMTRALGDSSPEGRPLAPLAMLLLYGLEASDASSDASSEAAFDATADARALLSVPSSTTHDGSAGIVKGAKPIQDAGNELHRHLRAAAAMVHARGLSAGIYKALVVKDDECDEGCKGASASSLATAFAKQSVATGSAAGPPSLTSAASSLDSPQWQRALRAVVATNEDYAKLRLAAQTSLPQLFLLTRGAVEPWPNAVRTPYELVDVLAVHAALGAPAHAEVLSLSHSNFSLVAKNHPLLLATFTTKWCARCLEVAPQLQRAALLLRRLQPAVPVTLATVDVSDPENAHAAADGSFVPDRRMKLASFPVGKLFSNGNLFATYTRGPSASEIAQEMMARAEEIKALKGPSRGGGGRGAAWERRHRK